MNDFDKICIKLGYKKPYEEIPLFLKERDNYYNIAVFDVENYYTDDPITEDQVKNILNFYPRSVYKKESEENILPRLVADYYAYRYDWANELKWREKIKQI